jgi:hypothetical protein
MCPSLVEFVSVYLFHVHLHFFEVLCDMMASFFFLQGNNMTSIEPDGGAINDFCIFQNSGLMLLALDNSQIPAHFIPALGPAPKWCSHLDNLTVRQF